MSLEFLRKPYYLNTSLPTWVLQAIVFGAFVFLFLFLFRPFQIERLPYPMWFIAGGFGLITLIPMLLLNVIFPRILPNYFQEEKWTVGREILWTIVNVSIIGLGNFAFYRFTNSDPFSLSGLLWFQGITLAIGVWPISLVVLLKENKERHKFTGEAEQINKEITPQAESPSETSDEAPSISLPAAEYPDLTPSSFLYAQASDNYVDIFYFGQKRVRKQTVRTTMKAVAANLEIHPHFFRCHKSYLVNLHQVIHVSGNAQGYKLHLKDSEVLIPVSRQHNDVIRQKLAAHH